MSLPCCVIDASVVIKLFLPEPFTEDVTLMFSEYIAHPEYEPFVVPDLFYIECANILWKRVKRLGELDEHLAQQHIRDLCRLKIPSVSSDTLAERAVEIGMTYDITAYDACYIALSEQRGIPFLTGDERLMHILQSSPYTLVDIPDYIAGCLYH